MAKSVVTSIVDRWEGAFVIFHRDYSEFGRIYYKPSASSMSRYARAIHKLHNQNCVSISRHHDVPIYRFIIKRR